MLRTRIHVLLLCVAIGVVLFVVYRSDIARFVWVHTHAMPEVLLLASWDAELGLEMGDYYFDTDSFDVAYDIERAERLYRWSTTIDPSIGDGYYERARVAFLKREYETALAYLQKQIDVQENTRPRVYYLQGLIHAFAGAPEAALAAFKTYYTYDQKSWYIHNNLAWVYFQLGEYEAVDRVSREGLQHNPKNPWLLMDRAVAQFNLGNGEQARALLAEAEASAARETPESWLEHYPGNDPQIAALGLEEFQRTLAFNKDLFHRQ